MRISDWSSDVCSSDLRAEVGVVGEDLVGLVLEGRQAARDFPGRRIVQVGRGEERRVLGGHERGQHVLLLRAAPAGGVLQAHGVGEVVLRSEEHTSELQSLMGISYAGICSKKKQRVKEQSF